MYLHGKYSTDISLNDELLKNRRKETRLSRKEINKELENLVSAGVYPAGDIRFQIYSAAGWITITHPKRKEIRARLRQLSSEAFCVDKTLAERIDKIADGV
jgi:hypothetical protein